jgi:hypothetical protein
MVGITSGMNSFDPEMDSTGKATRFTGYATQVVNMQLEAEHGEGEGLVWANDKRLLLTGEQMLALGRWREREAVTFEESGRHGLSPLAALRYFDPCWMYPIPLVHAGIYGVLKVCKPHPTSPVQPPLFNIGS